MKPQAGGANRAGPSSCGQELSEVLSEPTEEGPRVRADLSPTPGYVRSARLSVGDEHETIMYEGNNRPGHIGRTVRQRLINILYFECFAQISGPSCQNNSTAMKLRR